MENLNLLSHNNAASYARLASIITETLARAPDNLRLISLESIINQLVPLKPVTGPNHSRVAATIIEAVVLSSSPLLKQKNKQSAEHKVLLQSPNKQQFEITSKTPIPVGTRIQLQINNNDTATLMKVLNAETAQAKPTIANTTNTTSTTPGHPAPTRRTDNRELQRQGPVSSSAKSEQTAVPSRTDTTANKAALNTIALGVRQTLPQQQPVKALLPVLQQLAQNPHPDLPKSVTAQIQSLLQQFPKPEQLQHPKLLKQTLRNSGVFLESKLAFAAASKNTQALLKSPALQLDTKTQLQKLSKQVDQLQQRPTQSDKQTTAQRPLPNSATSTEPAPKTGPEVASKPVLSERIQAAPVLPGQTSTSSRPASNQTTAAVATNANDSDTPATTNPAQASTTATQSSVQAAASTARESNLDIVLQQLGRQLLASLARTQLNQMESLVNRASNTPDSQGPTNSWVLELPIIHGQNVDNLELRIDQEENQQTEGNAKEKQWTVMLGFDLHQLGKMSVQLKIVGTSVSATVWSQLQHTHNEVQEQIDTLQKGLEKIGVNVERVSCYHGLPSKDAPQIHQQLVDLHT